MSVKVLVTRVAGTNCDVETAATFRLAGAEAEVLHFNRLAEAPERLRDYDIIALPGGFSYGDDIGSGVVYAQQMRLVLRVEIERFLERGGLMLGICNGFQTLVKSGLMTPKSGWFDEHPDVTLTWNASARYEDRWIRMQGHGGRTPWVAEDTVIECPVRHAEGRLIAKDEAVLRRLEDQGQVVFRYIDKEGKPTQRFPANPNGSQNAIAGLCSPSRQILGLMPHPECNVRYWHHPEWTRRDQQPEFGEGFSVFKAGVEACVKA